MRRFAVLIWATGILFLSPAPARAAEFDLVLEGGTIIDGTGAAGYRADVAIRDGRVVRIGDVSETDAGRRIHIEGLVVAPGFIDLHNHAEDGNTSALRSRNPKRRAAMNIVTQGVTTIVVNPDGNAPRSIASQRVSLAKRGFGPNVVLMAGHNTIRRQVMGDDAERPATDSEVSAMRHLLREALNAGAYGLTAGLEYEPSIWSTTDELIALCEELVPGKRPFIVHERASGADPMWYLPSQAVEPVPTMLDNIRELIQVAEATGVPVVATHIKARGANYWGKSAEMIALIDKARDRGVPIYADQYPYNSSGSDGAIVLIPDWAYDPATRGAYGTRLRTILDDDSEAAKLREDVAYEIRRRGGAEHILFLGDEDPERAGLSLASEAMARGLSPVDLAIDLQLENPSKRGGVALRGFSMSVTDVEALAKQPWCATASDGGAAMPTDKSRVHPRYYGTFPRKLGEFARERDLFSLEFAVRSATGLPAEILGLRGRGVLAEGAVADLVVFDPKTIGGAATFFAPHQYSKGVVHVLINGKFAVEDGETTAALPGEVIVHDAGQ